MDFQILAKLSELKTHFDSRLDEIYSMIKIASEAATKPPVVTPPVAVPEVPIGAPVPSPIIPHAVAVPQVPVSTWKTSSSSPILPNGIPNGIPTISNCVPSVQTPVPAYPTTTTFPTVQKAPVAPVVSTVARTPSPYSVLSNGFQFGETLKYLDIPYDRPIGVSLSFIYSIRNMFLHIDYQEVENFYVNLNAQYAKIAQNNDVKLNSNAIFPKQLCCAYNADEQSYYRAQILNETDGKFFVRFVDFGDLKMVDAKDLYKLLPEFAKAPAFAIHCYLEGFWTTDLSKIETVVLDFLTMPNSYCTAIRGIFGRRGQSASQVPVTLEIKTCTGEWKNLLACNFDNVGISDNVSKNSFDLTGFMKTIGNTQTLFAKSNEAFREFLSTFDNRLRVGESYPGFCPHVHDVSNFIFAKKGVIEFTSNLSFFYRGLIEHVFNDVKPKTLVVFSIDNFYFRGYVLSSTRTNYEVLSIDLGFVYTVKSGEAYHLLEEFSLERIPCFAAFCALNIVPILDTWTPVAIKTFYSFIQGIFTLYPKKFNGGTHFVEVEMHNKNRASEMMKKFKLGKDDSN